MDASSGSASHPRLLCVSVDLALTATYRVVSQVDSFLVATTNASTFWHSGSYAAENPVIRADRAWEEVPPAPGFESDSGPKGMALPFSGGSWYYNGSFHLFYNCGPDPSTCYATSTNGKVWTKPPVNNGTNRVVGSAPHDGNTVWLDRRDRNPSRRWKIAEVRRSNANRAFTLLTSANGQKWRVVKSKTGPIYDRSSECRNGWHRHLATRSSDATVLPTAIFFDPFRDRWIFSNKVSGHQLPWPPPSLHKCSCCVPAKASDCVHPCACSNQTAPNFGRSRAHLASNGSSICEWAPDGTCTAESAAWTKLDDPQDPNEPRPWAVSDVDDPVLMMPNGSEFQFNSGLGCADCMTTNVGAAAPFASSLPSNK